MIWLVCGGRKFEDRELLDRVMREVLVEYGMPDKVVHGGATGADTMAGEWATRMGIDVVVVPAAWEDLSHPDAVIRHHPKTGRAYDALAGVRRNQKMLDEHSPDLLVALPGKTGTLDMIFRGLKAKVRTVLVNELGVMQTVDFPDKNV